MELRRKGAETRERIVDEAIQLFSVKGFHNTSINDILDATGLTKGGLYGHFPSKEAIWDSVYEEAVSIWKGIVFEEAQEIEDPLERIENVIEKDMAKYLGENVFRGGCFFLNMLVELSGQSEEMARKVWSGFEATIDLFVSWLEEADRKGLLRPGLDFKEVAQFIIVSINGAAALYAPTKDPAIWQSTVSQLRSYIRQLRN